MNYLLDRDTCIYWLKGRQSVRDRLLAVEWEQIAICVITAGDLYYGAYNSSRVLKNLTRASLFIEQLPALTLTDRTLRSFEELKAELRKSGQIIADFDLLIASVALTENRILVTSIIRH